MDTSLSDKEIFQCTHCHRHYSIRQGSFWSYSKLPLPLLLSSLYFFCRVDSVKQMVDHLNGEVSKTSIIQWFNYFHDVCTTWINNTRLRFDGQIYALLCDETAIGGKRKYLHGRYLKEPRWLFGIVLKQDHKILLRFVPNKEKLTLCPIIYQHCRRGSTINTDGFNSSRILSDMGFTHKVIIHKN